MLITHNQFSTKNETWAHWSPNECYNDPSLSLTHLGLDYRELNAKWLRQNHQSFKRLWFEVRIISSRSSQLITFNRKWWDHPAFMDKVFWVFQQPFLSEAEENQYYYALEFYECQRVKMYFHNELGKNVFSSDAPMLIVPKDCVQQCWDEMKAGESEHLRPREEVIPTQEELDYQGKFREEVDRKLELIGNIPEDKMDQLVGPLDGPDTKDYTP